MMTEAVKHQSLSSRWWWLDGPNTMESKRSPWLQSAIAELDEKTMAMLKLIEEDADSFAQRAEMYYKKRPELINMVQDFYRTHRSLVERCDQLKSESRLSTPRSSLAPLIKCQSNKQMGSQSSSHKDYDSCSEIYELDECDESDVEDPDEPPLEEAHFQTETKTKSISFDYANNDPKWSREEDTDEYEESDVEDPEPEEAGNFGKEARTAEVDEEMMKLREEVERLKEENRTQKEQLMQKDEEKREVIRQLSIAMDLLREENTKMKQRVAATKNPAPKKQKAKGIEFNKFKDALWGRIFS